MQIQCEYCGTRFNTLKHANCPSCGASTEGNSQLQQEMERQRAVDELNIQDIENRIEKQRLENEAEKLRQKNGYTKYSTNTTTTRSNTKFVAKFSIAIIVFVVIFIGIMISTIFEMVSDVGGVVDILNTTAETEPPETKADVGFGETANTGRVAVAVTKFEEYYYPWQKPAEGFKYVRFLVSIQNVTEKRLRFDSEVICTYLNEIGNQVKADTPTINSDDLDSRLRVATLESGLSTEGWVYFIVPKDADLLLYYGDFVTVTVPAEECIGLAE